MVIAWTLADEGWAGIRVAYGLCGIVVMDKDVRAVAGYLDEHQVFVPYFILRFTAGYPLKAFKLKQ